MRVFHLTMNSQWSGPNFQERNDDMTEPTYQNISTEPTDSRDPGAGRTPGIIGSEVSGTAPLKPSIYGITRSELVQWLEAQGEKRSRAELIWRWLYLEPVERFSQMSDLTPVLQAKLADHFQFDPLHLAKIQTGEGTTKFLFRLGDGHLIETVLMRQGYGNSVCVTTQVGCNIGCRFCASGLLRKLRDLTAGEITAQILAVRRWLRNHDLGEQVTHITIMGIGEPFDNYEEVTRFIRIVTDQRGLVITPKNITVSTSGLAPKIRAFAREGLKVRLAVSLHAPNDGIRSRLMRINDAYPIAELMAAITDYIALTNHRVFFEYILIKDLNDRPEHAEELARLLKPLGKKAYVNLIPCNPVPEQGFARSSEEAIHEFFDRLMKNGVNCIRRRELGTDIEGACGQLRSQHMQTKADFILQHHQAGQDPE